MWFMGDRWEKRDGKTPIFIESFYNRRKKLKKEKNIINIFLIFWFL